MNARANEKKYGGFTLGELRELNLSPVVNDLVTELEATSAPEVVQRLRRMETKVHKIAVHVGAEPDERSTMTLSAAEQDGERRIFVPGHDVTLAQLKRMSERAGWPEGVKLYVIRGVSLLGSVVLTGGE